MVSVGPDRYRLSPALDSDDGCRPGSGDRRNASSSPVGTAQQIPPLSCDSAATRTSPANLLILGWQGGSVGTLRRLESGHPPVGRPHRNPAISSPSMTSATTRRTLILRAS